jgi:oligopeptide/dipeptide ABC transporter ATP-binding protein
VIVSPPVPVLEAKNLGKQYAVGRAFAAKKRVVHALSDISLAIYPGETVAVVGESGCGKSTLARCLMWLSEPTEGSVRLRGEDVRTMLATDRLRYRRAVQIVFQDPYASLNPRRTIGQSIDDPLRVHGLGNRAERRIRVEELLAQVGLSKDFISRYPHELSGGQRQRVAIARALAPKPDVIICDEAVSALDVSIQAQIINLLKDIQAETGVAYLFITHNLHLVQRIADRIVVMYLGQVVEECDAAVFRHRFLHPYSKALFAAAPRVRRGHGPAQETRSAVLAGEVPSPIDPPSGCRFHTRCPIKRDVCAQEAPALLPHDGRRLRCPFAEAEPQRDDERSPPVLVEFGHARVKPPSNRPRPNSGRSRAVGG